MMGLAQSTSGRHTLPWDERFRLDVWYVDDGPCRATCGIRPGDHPGIALQGSDTLDSESADFEFMGNRSGQRL